MPATVIRHHRTLAATATALTLVALTTACSNTPQPTATPTPSASADGTLGTANTAITRDPSTSHVEPYLAINPANPASLLATARTRRPNDPSLGVIATYRSSDGGTTWHDNGPLPQPPGYQFTADSTVAFTPNGTGLIVAEGPKTSPEGGDTDATSADAGVFLWRTTDGGATFTPPIQLSPPGHPADHTWLALGQAGTAEADTAYVVWNSDNHVELAQSSDAGRTFTAPRTIADVGTKRAFATVAATGSDGHLDVTYAVAPPTGDVARFLIRSTDGGRTFTSPIAVGSAPGRVTIPGVPAQSNLQSLVTDPKTGDAFLAYAITAGNGTAIQIWKATDRSASLLATVSPPAAGTSLSQPQLASPGDGRLLLSYFTSRSAGTQETFAIIDTTDGGSRTLPIGTAAFDPARSTITIPGVPPIVFIGDYQGLAIAAHTVHLIWNDTRDGHQAQLYTARFPLGTPGR